MTKSEDASVDSPKQVGEWDVDRNWWSAPPRSWALNWEGKKDGRANSELGSGPRVSRGWERRRLLYS